MIRQDNEIHHNMSECPKVAQLALAKYSWIPRRRFGDEIHSQPYNPLLSIGSVK